MIRCFRKSRAAFIGIIVVTLILAAAVIWQDRGRPIYIPILACTLLLLLGIVCARLAGNLIADREHMRLLSLLHVSLEPQPFIEQYEPLIARLPQKSAQRPVMKGYLSSGYAAAGGFEKALVLLPEEEDGLAAALKGVRLAARASCFLYLGAEEQAAAQIGKLSAVIASAEKPALKESLAAQRDLLSARLSILRGEAADCAWLSQQLNTAPYRLRRLEILHALAEDARNQRLPALQSCLKKLREEAGKTWYGDWANRIS